MPTPDRQLLRAHARILLPLTLIACGGTQCGGCQQGESTYVFPLNDAPSQNVFVQPDSAKVRITQGLLDFIQPRVGDLLKAGLASSEDGSFVDENNVLHATVPDGEAFDLWVASAETRDGKVMIWLDDLDDSVQVDFVEPNYVRIHLDDVRIGLDMQLYEQVIGSSSLCPIEGRLGPDGPGPLQHAVRASLDMLIDPGVGPDPDRAIDVQVEIDETTIHDFDIDVLPSSQYCQNPDCSDCVIGTPTNCFDPGGACGECIAFCGIVTNFLADGADAAQALIAPLLDAVLRRLLQNQIDKIQELAGANSAKFEQAVDISTFIDLEAATRLNPLGIFLGLEPGRIPVAEVNGAAGMNINATGGGDSQLADCIHEVPAFEPVAGPAPDLSGIDSLGQPYHMGMTLSQDYLNHMFHSAHRAGTLCLKLTTQDVVGFGSGFIPTVGLLSLLAPELSRIADPKAPLAIETRPTEPIKVTFGTNEGEGADKSWLIEASMPNFIFALNGWIEDRYVRILEVGVDVGVGFDIVPVPAENRLELAAGDFKINNFQVYFQELIPNFEPEALAPLIEGLLGDALGSGGMSFDIDLAASIAEVLGTPMGMKVNEIFRDGLRQDYLTASFTFEDLSGAPMNALGGWIDTVIEEVQGPEHAKDSRIKVRIKDVGHPVDIQIRVDNGMWHAPVYSRDGWAQVSNPFLYQPGVHQIEVRARRAGLPWTLDMTPARTQLRVDHDAPVLTAKPVSEGLAVEIRDRGTAPGETITLLSRGPRGQTAPHELVVEDDGFARIELKKHPAQLIARDLAKHETVLRLQALSEHQGDSEPAAGGCRSTDQGSAGLLMLLGGLMLGFRRRRT